MKKYSDISKELKLKSRTESYCGYDRDSFLKGSLFKVGDIVENHGRNAEVIDIGPNYVTLIREGKTFKSWITDISRPVSECKSSVPKNKNGQLSYKGYVTKNFNEELTSIFLDKYSNNSDSYAYYNCIVSCDNLMSVKSSALIEYYNKYNNEYLKVSKYLNKFDIFIPRVSIIGEALEMIRYNKEQYVV